ncbi:iron-containing alcohol dehydrogenase [Streptobacillus felis]|uniref:iron-containing alcohol dehydrogenase n=1 Tax=Streptobacillus felis TaxID=1384509 RepID=UPI0008322F0E|nr:iron-containing alcohol dehydrogenase [Streptobacillus felis]
MIDFTYKNDAKLIFGKNSMQYFEKEILSLGSKCVLMLSSGSYIKELGIYDEVVEVTKRNNIRLINVCGIVPNPRVELVREYIEICKSENVDLVLAVGGGSTMDTAKAVAVGAKTDIDIWEYFLYNQVPESALNIGVISTFASSGSECSNCSIISNMEYKLGLETDLIIPKFAIVNPEYTKTLPINQLYIGICDISSHLLERYITGVENVDVTDYMIEGMLKALIVNAERLIKDPMNMDARNEVSLLSIYAHNNILDSGRMSDWASHRIEHELSSEYGIIHGEGMAVVLVAYIKYMSNLKPKKFAQLANRLFNVDYAHFNLEEMALILSEKLEDIYRRLGLRTKLKEFEIDNSRFEEMALKATKNNRNKIGHYYPLDKNGVIGVLELAI